MKGISTAFCLCNAGYGDATVTDNKIEATNSAGLTCANVVECDDDSANTCTDSQDCVDSPGSYTCTCKSGWLMNSDANTVHSVPCIECSGPGATESNGACTCTDDTNAALATDSLCACGTGYKESNGLCVDITKITTTTSKLNANSVI